MLSCIDTSAQVGKFDRRECFPKFTEYLQTYFQILDDSIGNAGVSGQLEAFIIELRNLNRQSGQPGIYEATATVGEFSRSYKEFRC